MKPDKYQQDMMMIALQDPCQIGYLKDNYRLIAVDLSKQRALDADPRAIQQTVFQGFAGGDDNTKTRLYANHEQSKETVLEFCKGTAKLL